MEDCIFCKIIRGEVPSYKIYEDEYIYSFLDICNDGNGHILVIPKKHCVNILDCDEDILAHVMSTIKKISLHLTQNCGISGVNVLNASGKDAEQCVNHLHFHIYPRKAEDGLVISPKLSPNSISLEETCKKFEIKE